MVFVSSIQKEASLDWKQWWLLQHDWWKVYHSYNLRVSFTELKGRKTPADYGRLYTKYSIKQMARIALIKLVDSDAILYQATTSCKYLDFTYNLHCFLVEVNKPMCGKLEINSIKMKKKKKKNYVLSSSCFLLWNISAKMRSALLFPDLNKLATKIAFYQHQGIKKLQCKKTVSTYSSLEKRQTSKKKKKTE